MAKKISVLFVCLGNICRSPTAEAVFRVKVEAAGLQDRIDIESTALGSWNLGEPPHPETQAVLRQRNIPFDWIRAKRLSTEEIKGYDYIIAMDQSNVSELVRRGISRDRVQLLTDYIPGRQGEDVPDPYYYGNFTGVFDLIEEGVTGLLEHIKERLETREH